MLHALVFVLAITSVVSAPGAGAAGAPAGPPATRPADAVRLVTWNVHKCEAGVDQVIAELRRIDADLLCLQEVIEPRGDSAVPNQTRALAEALDMHAYSFGGPLDAARNQCLAILSRTPLTQTEPLSTAEERNYAVSARTTCGDHALAIVCVHLAGTYQADELHIRRTAAARERDWEDLLARAAGWREPTVLAGDFNTLPEAPPFARLVEHLRPAGDAAPTFPSSTPALALDHVFCTPDVQVRAAARPVASTASDHRPLVVEFQPAPDGRR